LDIPAFRYVEVIEFFHVGCVDVHDMSICRARTTESLPHRMLDEPIDACHHTLIVPLG